jgi:hypothetical protein
VSLSTSTICLTNNIPFEYEYEYRFTEYEYDLPDECRESLVQNNGAIFNRVHSIVRWILKPDDAPPAVLFGGCNVHVAVAIQVNEVGVIHLLA